MKRAIELIRVSTEGQANEDRAGIPAQKEANRRTAERHQLKVVRTIEIIDVSGAAVMLSAEMQELIALIRSPEIHGVVTKEFSRLMRPEKYTDYALLQEFADSNTILYLPDGPVDLSSKSGSLMAMMRAAMAGAERRDIAERMQDAKEAMRRAGKNPGGAATLPYGVGYSKEIGWFYTAEAQKVKHAFDLFEAGFGYTEIARKLNIPRTNIHFMLQNPIYKGYRLYREKRDPSSMGYVSRPNGRQGYRRKISRPASDVINIRVLEGIVTEEMFSAVQSLIQRRKDSHSKVRAESANRYTYNGFLRCGDCSCPMYTHTANDEYFVCKSHHPREKRRRAAKGLLPCKNTYILRKKIEPRIDALLSRKLQQLDFLRRVVRQLQHKSEEEINPVTPDIGDIEAQISRLKGKRHRIVDAYFEGIINKEDRVMRLEKLDAEIDALEQMSGAKGDIRRPTIKADIATLTRAIEPFLQWEFLSRQDKRKILEAICPAITVNSYSIQSVTLSLPTQEHCDNDSRLKTEPSASRARLCR